MQKHSPTLGVAKEKTFLIKSLRGDPDCYASQFFRMITPSATTPERPPIRPFLKKKFTVTGKGVIKRKEKTPLYSAIILNGILSRLSRNMSTLTARMKHALAMLYYVPYLVRLHLNQEPQHVA